MAQIPDSIQSRIVDVRRWHRNVIDGFVQILDIGPNSYKLETAWQGNIKLFNNLLQLLEQFLYDLESARAKSDITEAEFITATVAFDALLLEITTDAELAEADDGTSAEFLRSDGDTFPIKYRVKIDVILAEAGLQPAAPLNAGQFTPLTSNTFSNTGTFGSGSGGGGGSSIGGG